MQSSLKYEAGTDAHPFSTVKLKREGFAVVFAFQDSEEAYKFFELLEKTRPITRIEL